MMPQRTATATACARLRASSPERHRLTCDLAVSMCTPRTSAICSLVRPSAISSSVSMCRAVKPARRRLAPCDGKYGGCGPPDELGLESRIDRARASTSGSRSRSAIETASSPSGRPEASTGEGSSDSEGGRQLSSREEGLDRFYDLMSTAFPPAAPGLRRARGRLDHSRRRMVQVDELVMGLAEGAEIPLIRSELDEAGVVTFRALPELLELGLMVDREQLRHVATATVYLERTALAVANSNLPTRRRPAWVPVETPPGLLPDASALVRGLMLRAARAGAVGAAGSSSLLDDVNAGVEDRHLTHHTSDAG